MKIVNWVAGVVSAVFTAVSAVMFILSTDTKEQLKWVGCTVLHTAVAVTNLNEAMK